MGRDTMNLLKMLVLVVAATNCICQTVDLRGIVKDASTGSLISGAIIRLEGTELRDTSDATGEFRITNGISSVFPGRSLFHQAGSGVAQLKIFRFASARMVMEYSARLSPGRYEWPMPRLPAGLYLLEVRAANSVTRRRFVSLGQGASVATHQPTLLDGIVNPALAKAWAAQRVLEGNMSGYFLRRQTVETSVMDRVTVLLRRHGSFDGLWIGNTESQDTMMMAIEGDSLAYLRGPDSLVTDDFILRRIFQVPSIFFPTLPSGNIANDSITGGVPVDLPELRYKFDVVGGFASDSTAAGKMNILVEQPSDTLGGPDRVVSLNTAWAAVKSSFATGFDGSWKGINSKGDSLRFEVQKGRVNAYSIDIRLGTPECGRNGGFETKGFPYWVLRDGRFSILQLERESNDTSTFTYRLNGRFTNAMSASGASSFTYSKSSPHFPPCEISDSVTWTAIRMP